MADTESPMTARIAAGVAAVDSAAWDDVAGTANPFVSHAFLSALEDSGSVGHGTGWQPAPILIDGGDGALEAALPAYLKGHSQGEYVFDHSWAEAYENAGGRYYPKLLIAVPFTPVPGPRLLAKDDQRARQLIAAAEAVVQQNHLSSAHATFVDPGQLANFQAADWLVREGVQFHFTNPGYREFEEFLGSLTARKRKNIRRERATANADVEVRLLTGAAILPEHWDAMWLFYQDTGARKWGRPYLTRSAFDLLGERMAENLLLVLAYRHNRPIAGALNLIGADALYGRYWGCIEEVPCLHFELCYYRAIDFAIERGLARVEAGAQGEHKLARGYAPVPTWSAHFLPDAGFRRAVADFIDRETHAVEREIGWLAAAAPFKRG
jgi:predicted N-acyltransferase